jgi:protein-disulfide isomerase
MVKTETKILGTIFVLCLIIMGGAVFLLSRNQAPAQQTDQGTIYQIDYSKGVKTGPDDAKVKLVEFGDFQCPACAAAEPVLRTIRQQHASDVQIIFRHFPLSIHLNARPAANAAAQAATEGKFWQMHDKLYDTQQQWQGLSDPQDFFAGLAKEVGVDENKVKEAVKNASYNDLIQSDLTEGGSLGVNSTPTFYLNGRKLEIASFDQLVQEVDNALKNP